jgi:U4/U6 small nuclear ribonucleoprotein PRP31
MLDFLERKMHVIAPNTLSIVGPTVCAKLISSAGGIVELSRTPACNIQVLGSQKKALHGMSTASVQLHRGHIGELDMVKNAPAGDQIKLVRMLATKSALAARIDAAGTHPDGEEGAKLKQGIMDRYAKITAPGQQRLVKVLPKPDEKPRKKRGGKKTRNMREKYAMTMHRKMANTMTFGPEAQQEHTQTGHGFGLIGMAGSGNLKGPAKKEQKILKKPMVPLFGNDQASGLVSSVAITPMQGMELINPDLLQKRVSEAKSSYFSAQSGFTTVINDLKK